MVVESAPKIVDRVGEKYGRLLVKKYAGKIKGRHWWACLCECGNTKEITSAGLRTTKSCGCLQKEHVAKLGEKKRRNLKGTKFGRLTPKKLVVNTKNGTSLWLCSCDCGAEKVVSANTLLVGGTTSCGCYHREKITTGRMGYANPNWRGDQCGLSSLHRWIRNGKPKPDCCECCGKKTHYLDLANISQKYFRDPNDFEWLCRLCHMEKDGRIKNRNTSGQFVAANGQRHE